MNTYARFKKDIKDNYGNIILKSLQIKQDMQ